MDAQGITQDEASELAYASDSQLIMSVVNAESLAILGSLVTSKGREIKFMDGILSPPGKESPLTKLVAISTHHSNLVNTIGITKMRNANTLNSLRMGAGSPMVLLPPNTRKQLDRAANSCGYLHASTAWDAFPPQLDHEPNNYVAIYSTDATANMFCMVVYEDPLLLEIYLMKKGETLKDARSQINFADSCRLEWAYKIKRTRTGEEKIISNLLTFDSVRKFNLFDWGHLNSGGITRYYPEDSSQTNYLEITTRQMPAKLRQLRLSMEEM